MIRPTGLIDPPVEIRPVSKDGASRWTTCIDEVRKHRRAPAIARLVTVLTKKMAEDLTEYMHEQGLRVRYMHSDIDTIERIEIIRDLRLGAFDMLVGINLLREGLDIPECGLVAILDADKEGFLRSETSLIQTIGRAARNVDGRVILYADRITGSMERAMAETEPPPREAGRLQRRARHHPGEHQGPTSRTSSPAPTNGRPRHRARRRGRGRPPLRRLQLQGHPARPGSPRCARPPPTSNSRTAARLRDEIKRLKLLDLEFANEALTGEGEAVDRAAPKRARAAARADAAERFRKGRGERPSRGEPKG